MSYILINIYISSTTTISKWLQLIKTCFEEMVFPLASILPPLLCLFSHMLLHTEQVDWCTCFLFKLCIGKVCLLLFICELFKQVQYLSLSLSVQLGAEGVASWQSVLCRPQHQNHNLGETTATWVCLLLFMCFRADVLIVWCTWKS